MAEPNAANVFAGPAALYVAAFGVAPPSLATKPSQATWITATWTPVGYTEAGVELVTTPSVKDVTPDEEITPVLQIVTGIKVEVKATLLEATIENMQRAIALTALTNPGLGIKTLALGSGNSLTNFALGIQGPTQGGVDSRVITVWKANIVSAVTLNSSKKNETKLAVTFTALADSTKANTRNIYEVTDFNAGS
jgi:hypothetical protein